MTDWLNTEAYILFALTLIGLIPGLLIIKRAQQPMGTHPTIVTWIGACVAALVGCVMVHYDALDSSLRLHDLLPLMVNDSAHHGLAATLVPLCLGFAGGSLIFSAVAWTTALSRFGSRSRGRAMPAGVIALIGCCVGTSGLIAGCFHPVYGLIFFLVTMALPVCALSSLNPQLDKHRAFRVVQGRMATAGSVLGALLYAAFTLFIYDEISLHAAIAGGEITALDLSSTRPLFLFVAMGNAASVIMILVVAALMGLWVCRPHNGFTFLRIWELLPRHTRSKKGHSIRFVALFMFSAIIIGMPIYVAWFQFESAVDHFDEFMIEKYTHGIADRAGPLPLAPQSRKLLIGLTEPLVGLSEHYPDDPMAQWSNHIDNAPFDATKWAEQEHSYETIHVAVSGDTLATSLTNHRWMSESTEQIIGINTMTEDDPTALEVNARCRVSLSLLTDTSATPPSDAELANIWLSHQRLGEVPMMWAANHPSCFDADTDIPELLRTGVVVNGSSNDNNTLWIPPKTPRKYLSIPDTQTMNNIAEVTQTITESIPDGAAGWGTVLIVAGEKWTVSDLIDVCQSATNPEHAGEMTPMCLLVPWPGKSIGEALNRMRFQPNSP